MPVPAPAATRQASSLCLVPFRMQQRPIMIPSLAVAGSGLLWGIWWIPLRWLEATGLSGDWASVAIYAAATAVMAPYVLVHRRRLLGGGLDVVLVGLLSGAAFSTWNHALIGGDVVRVTLLFYLAPVWGTAFGVLFFRDPVSPLRLLSIVLGLSGAAVVLGLRGGLPLPRNLPEWMALVSGVLFALAAICSRRSPTAGGLEKTFLNCVFGGIVSLAMAVLLGAGAAPSLPSAAGSALPILVCLIWQIPVTWALLWGATRLDAGRIGILLLLEVLGAAVSAAILTDEPFGWREAFGCTLIIAAGLSEGLDEIRLRRALRRAAG